MSKLVKVSLKDKAKNYDGQDLSLQVFIRGSIALEIKIGGDWNSPDSYDIPYEGGECRVVVGRSVKNGRMESKLISLDDPQFAGDYVDVLMSDSSIDDEDSVVMPSTGNLSGVSNLFTPVVESEGFGSYNLSATYTLEDGGCCGESEDSGCCGESEDDDPTYKDCCDDKDKPF